jgi:hypothetical protein
MPVEQLSVFEMRRLGRYFPASPAAITPARRTSQIFWSKWASSLSIAVAFVAFFPPATKAQAPRDYIPPPVDAATFQLFLTNTNTATASVSDSPLPNNETVNRSGTASLLWSFPLGSRYGGIGATGGYIGVKGTGAQGHIKATGFSDPSITFHTNIFGGPALTTEQLAHAVRQTFMSFHFNVTMPLGSYDPNEPVNTGSHRWVFGGRLLNLSITPDKGVSWFELYGGANFYTDNNEFRGNNQLSQTPLGTTSVFYSRNFGSRWFAGIGGTYNNGGTTSVNNISQHNSSKDFQPSVTISRARTIWKYRVTLRYVLTGNTPAGAPKNNLFQLVLAGPLYTMPGSGLDTPATH